MSLDEWSCVQRSCGHAVWMDSGTNSHRCASTNTLTGDPCRRPVSNDSWVAHCADHRFCGRRGSFLLTVDAYRERRRKQHQIVRMVANHVWRDEMARRGTAAVGQQVWDGLRAETGTDACEALNALAHQLEQADPRDQQRTAEAFTGSIANFPRTHRAVAGLVGQLVLRHGSEAAEVARAVRLLGVFGCSLRGRPDQCASWRCLVRSVGIEEAKQQLGAGLPGVLAA